MKKELHKHSLRVTIFLAAVIYLLTCPAKTSAQCPAGSSTANLNWDNLDYLVTTGSYAGYVTAAMSQTQAFAMGVNRVVIVYPAGMTTTGENTAHTGEAGSFGTGADVQYSGGGNLTFTFDDEVSNFQFSLYDIDNSQRVNVTAVNAGGTPQLITMTKPAGGIVTITNSGTTNAQGQAPATLVANTSNTATVNVLITGPVKSVTVALSGTNGDFWLSDFTACVTGSFPLNYFIASRPFTGQPTYVIGTSDTNTVSLINVATGRAKMIFQDATSPRYINGLGYDHLQHNLYYVIDFTANPAVNKTIKRYDFDSQTISVLVPNVNTLGIPTYNRGVESAGCAFYDNDLYFGVEGNLTPGNNGGRETIIWRIEFDAPGGNAIKACQVYATPSDDGAGTSLHDWNDFTIADGLLVDFAGSPTVSARRFTHYDLQTQQIIQNYYTGGLTPRQAGITWNNTRYWVYDSIAVYNMNGTIGPRTRITGSTVLDWTGFCGDATGFRPKSDFGDAPASYDPDPLSPALHDKDTALFLGVSFNTAWDEEFDKYTSPDATGDGPDDNDGLLFTPIFDPSSGSYLATVRVRNNTGSNARLIAWLDFNGNGYFDATEAITPVTVPSSPSGQVINLFWPSTPSTLVSGTYTFLRIRITSQANGMGISNSTGYYNSGEVEDYRVIVDDFPLSAKLITFDAKAEDNSRVLLSWTTTDEQNLSGFSVERSGDGVNWSAIGFADAKGNGTHEVNDYRFYDMQPLPGRSFYRLLFKNMTGKASCSETRTVLLFSKDYTNVNVIPNPVKGALHIVVESMKKKEGVLQVTDVQGRVLLQQKLSISEGTGSFTCKEAANWPAGSYYLVITTNEGTMTSKFTVLK
ncbi:MAG: GEVED domain-containing protein [Chitinophagaceae bacterium]